MFLKQVAKTYPRVPLHIVRDNCGTPTHPDVRAGLDKHPRITLHFTRMSGSWLNMAEAAGPPSSAARSRASCAPPRRHTDPPEPLDASAASPPARQRRRHAYAEFDETRSRRATSGGVTPSANHSAACSRTSSRLARPATDRPPPSGYLITPQ